MPAPGATRTTSGPAGSRSATISGVPGVTTHSFRKSVATLIDDEGLSARIGADHLGHSRISMTQDKYMARGRVHNAVADMLDRTINAELGGCPC